MYKNNRDSKLYCWFINKKKRSKFDIFFHFLNNLVLIHFASNREPGKTCRQNQCGLLTYFNI